jgi:hypothetical protein
MTTITLTEEQERAIVAKHIAEFNKTITQLAAQHVKATAGVQRRADARVARARQSTKQWKVQYAETRSKLLAAQAEIVALKRRLRNGEWGE